MPKGIALTTGLNAVSPAHYGGWSGELNACEADAKDMAEIAQSKGFVVKTLLTKAATRANVIDGINKASVALTSGDIFMLSYSGHGGQLPDLNSDEDDAQDETWCLYDGELIDDEIYALLGKFAQGVRILVFSDGCHSGKVTKMAYYQSATIMLSSKAIAPETRYRFMPMEVAVGTYRDNKKFYVDAQVEQLAGHAALLDATREEADAPARRWRIAPLALIAPLPDAGSLAPAWRYLLASQLRDCTGGSCLWWTSGSERVGPCLLVMEGMPDAAAFKAMLDGNWPDGG